MHSHAKAEVLMPKCACQQLDSLINAGKITVVNEADLSPHERETYNYTHSLLSNVMIDPRNPNKNMGETCSLAYAKAKSIPIFATDERYLQQIIYSSLNTGINDICCLRIVDIVKMARDCEISMPRKTAKALWAIAGKDKAEFDRRIWPLNLPGVAE